MNSMQDALSSASLLLAALALVYSSWSGSIDTELNRTYSGNVEQKEREKERVRLVLHRRAWPLAIASWSVVIAFVPRLLDIVGFSLSCTENCTYDDVSAVFLLTVLLMAGLALHLSGMVFALHKKLK